MSEYKLTLETTLVRRIHTVTIESRPRMENAAHFKMLFRQIPDQARLDTIEADDVECIVLTFIEEEIISGSPLLLPPRTL